MRPNAWYGWKPDLPDKRDKLYKIESFVIPDKVLPPLVDLRPKISKIYNQGSLGSCTAQAIAGAIHYIQPNFLGSRLFIYYNERRIIGTIKEDSGAMIRDGIKSVVKDGVCPEEIWKYIIEKFTQKPPQKCYRQAEKNQVTKYLRITNLHQMKSCLAQGYPVIFGFSVYESFESEEVAKTGMMSMPKDDEVLVGGHAVLAVGYDDKTKRIIVKNSWGRAWGDKGYFYMPYDYIADQNLANDFWTIREKEL